MKVIVAGGRDFEPQQRHADWLKNQLAELGATEIVSGGCRGADAFGEQIAKELGLPIKVFNADWKTYGRSAGPMRNRLMSNYADACITFPGSYGTANMELLAKGVHMKLIRWLDRK